MNIKQSKQGNWFKRHKIISTVIAIFLLLCVIGAASGGKNNSPSAQSTKPTSSQTSDTSAQAQPVSSAPTEPTTAQKVSDWFHQYGSISQKISTDSGQISTDAGNSDYTAVAQDCQNLKSDATTAQSYPAIPDAQSAADFSAGMGYYISGAQDCMDGATQTDPSLISKSADEITQGNNKVQATINDIKAVGGSVQ